MALKNAFFRIWRKPTTTIKIEIYGVLRKYSTRYVVFDHQLHSLNVYCRYIKSSKPVGSGQARGTKTTRKV